MRNKKLVSTMIMFTLLFTFTACDNKKEGNKSIVKEPGSSIVVIDDSNEEMGEPVVSVEKIDKFENTEISDWIDEEKVIVSKENESLDKMELLELSNYYPRSLYVYDMNTKEYKLLKEEKNLFLGGATVSADKKHVLYYEYALGDPAYYVMNLDTLETFGLGGEKIGGAISAIWAGNDVIGSSYSNKAFKASTTGEITTFDDITEDGIYVIRKINNSLYYNTVYDTSLIRLDLNTKEKTKLSFNHVNDVIPSPDNNKMLVLQNDSTNSSLILSNIDGSEPQTIAEGTELSGVSWSPDQRMIVYNMKTSSNNTTVNGLYIYDMLTDEAIQIAVDTHNPVTRWSPSGDKFIYTEYNGEQPNSNIVYLTFSLEK